MVKRFSIHHDPSVETMSRSILKTISYELVILTLNFVTVYYITGRVRIALGFVVISSIYTMLSYFFHDRIWDKIKWGKVDPTNKK
jgi:uncharacterized membrane protein